MFVLCFFLEKLTNTDVLALANVRIRACKRTDCGVVNVFFCIIVIIIVRGIPFVCSPEERWMMT